MCSTMVLGTDFDHGFAKLACFFFFFFFFSFLPVPSSFFRFSFLAAFLSVLNGVCSFASLIPAVSFFFFAVHCF